MNIQHNNFSYCIIHFDGYNYSDLQNNSLQFFAFSPFLNISIQPKFKVMNRISCFYHSTLVVVSLRCHLVRGFGLRCNSKRRRDSSLSSSFKVKSLLYQVPKMRYKCFKATTYKRCYLMLSIIAYPILCNSMIV